jgi:DNA-binding response OmpR family regulator
VTSRILVVDDDSAIAEMIGIVLRGEGFEPHFSYDGAAAIESFASVNPDLVLLDVMLPGIDGIEVCRRLRTFTDAYIVMLTARTDEVDTLIGLSVGADDYLSKPFSPRILIARIKTLLRRPRIPAEPSSALTDQATSRRVGSLTVNPATRTVLIGDQPVEVTRIEFDLLNALTERPGQVLSRRQLIEQVWGPAWIGDDRLIDAHISHLRAKLHDDPASARFIITVRGVGFRSGTG